MMIKYFTESSSSISNLPKHSHMHKNVLNLLILIQIALVRCPNYLTISLTTDKILTSYQTFSSS